MDTTSGLIVCVRVLVFEDTNVASAVRSKER